MTGSQKWAIIAARPSADRYEPKAMTPMAGAKTPLGLVATELLATASVFVTLGGFLLVSGVTGTEHGRNPAASGVAVAVVLGAILLGKWRPLLLKSLARAGAGRALDNVEIESRRQTAIRAAWRLLIVAGPLAYVAWAKVPPVGEAVGGGMLIIMGLVFGAVSGGLRLWEQRHGRVLVRETRRWGWINADDRPRAGCKAQWQRLQTMRRRGRESGWQWFAVDRATLS